MRKLTYAEIQRRIAELQRSGATLPTAKEEAMARSAIETKTGVSFTDAEWSAGAANLRAFFAVLAEWRANDERPS